MLDMNNWVFEYNIALNLFSTAEQHGEWINNNYGHMVNRIVRYNIFKGGGMGATGVVVANNNNTDGDQIYGNVVANMRVSNGVFVSSKGQMRNAKIYNNTFTNVQALANVNIQGGEVFNNLFYANKDYNGNPINHANMYGAITRQANNLVVSTNPFVSGADFSLLLALPSGGGTALSSPFNLDMKGRVRGADGVWDLGAYEFLSKP